MAGPAGRPRLHCITTALTIPTQDLQDGEELDTAAKT